MSEFRPIGEKMVNSTSGQASLIFEDAMKTLQGPTSHFGLLKMNFFVVGIVLLFLCSISIAIIDDSSVGSITSLAKAFSANTALITAVFLLIVILPAVYRSAFKITSPIDIWANIKPVVYAYAFALIIQVLYSLYMSKFSSAENDGDVWLKEQSVYEGYCSVMNILENANAKTECADRSTLRKVIDSVLDTTNTVSKAVLNSFWFYPYSDSTGGGLLLGSVTQTLTILTLVFGLVQRACLKVA